MLRQGNAHVLVYQALDQVLAEKSVSAGACRSMFTAIDVLRTGGAPIDQVRRAEDIAIEIHRLRSALQQSDRRASRKALDKLKRLAVDWIDTRICSRH